MNNTDKLYKLIILYTLSKVDFPMTNSQLSEFIIGHNYTNFFKVQQTISELIESGFIMEESTHNRTFYHLTEEGAQTVTYFGSDLSAGIRKDIDQFLIDKRYELKNEVSVKADYFPNRDDSYSVNCEITEKDVTLLSLTIHVPSEEEASSITTNWSKKSEELYRMIMEKLL